MEDDSEDFFHQNMAAVRQNHEKIDSVSENKKVSGLRPAAAVK